MAGRDPHLHVLVLAGGVGSRFWPASTPSTPKQLLPLAGDRPLVAETVDRALALVPPERLHILTGEHLVDPIRSVLPPVARDRFLVEPRARGTGPVLAWAAWEIARSDPEAVLLSLHSDHLVDPPEAFSRSLTAAAEVARREDLLVTLGVEPDRPETGYGYIQPGAPLSKGSAAPADSEAFRVDRFVEKPGHARAVAYVEEGYLWNTGIFAWRARRFLEETRAHAPEIAGHLPALEQGNPRAFFQHVGDISVDEAVLERSARVACVRASFRWDDLGSWEALTRTHGRDEGGNVSVGEVHSVDTTDTIAYSTAGPIVLFGVEDLVVVRTSSVTFVADRRRAGALKALLRRLPEHLRDLERSE